MTQEEKAKRYDEAKCIMEKYLKSGNAGVIAENTIKNAFPELKESEDEKIRKAILEHIQLCTESIPDRDKFIAWLEKQEEQILANSAKTCKNEQKLFDYESVQQKEFAPKIEPNDYGGIDPYFFKPADKVESKPQGNSAVEANNEVLHNIPVIVDADKAFYDMICEYFDDGRAMDKDETNAFKEWLLRKIKRTN